MGMKCSDLFKRRYVQMIVCFIYLCKNSTNRYHLYLFMIITHIYHLYIEYELYNLAYKMNTCFIYEHQLIHGKIGKWDDHYKFMKVFRGRGNVLDVKL